MSEQRIPEGVATVEQSKSDVLKEGLLDALERAKKLEHESTEDFEERRQRQREIIGLLKDHDLSFFEDMVKTGRERYKSREELYGDPAVNTGAAFETLSRLEYRKKTGYFEKKSSPEHAVAIEAANQLMFLMRRPPEEIYENVRQLRKPDLIEIEVDEETADLKIKTFVEATSASLGDQKYSQITTYRRDTISFLRALQEIPDDKLERMGLTQLAGRILEFDVAENYDVQVVMSADIDTGDKDSYLDKNLSSTKKDRLAALKKNRDLTLIQSDFSSLDLIALREVFIENIQN